MIFITILSFIILGLIWFGSLKDFLLALSLLFFFNRFAPHTPKALATHGLKLITFLLLYTSLWSACFLYFNRAN
jgi:hypothetical protein